MSDREVGIRLSYFYIRIIPRRGSLGHLAAMSSNLASHDGLESAPTRCTDERCSKHLHVGLPRA